MPSTKDLTTQLQVQSNIPYAIGIIAGIYSTNTNFASSKKSYARTSESSQASISNSYFSFFRAVEEGGSKAGVAVSVTIHRRVSARYRIASVRSVAHTGFQIARMASLHLARHVPRCQVRLVAVTRRPLRIRHPVSTLPVSVVLAENQECHARRLAECRTDEQRVLESTSYARVLSLFRISSLFPLRRFIEEQSRQLKWNLAASNPAGAGKSVLSTSPIAVPASLIELRWGGSRPVHVLNAVAASHPSLLSPASPADEFSLDADDGCLPQQPSSSAKRNRVVMSDDEDAEAGSSRPVPAVASAPLHVVSAGFSAAQANAASLESARRVDSPAAAQAGSGGAVAAQRAANVKGGAASQQQQTPSKQDVMRQRNTDVVVVDD